jgi:hypothetical protein
VCQFKSVSARFIGMRRADQKEHFGSDIDIRFS